MQFLAIIVVSILAAVAYGVTHDQFTARICIEYFTIGHPPIFREPVTSPTVIGVAWGVIATWWMGAGLGLVLAIAARAGQRIKRSWRDVLPPIAKLLVVMAIAAILLGAVGRYLAQRDIVILIGPIADRVPLDRHVDFITCLWAHSTSYLVGGVGGLYVAWRVWRSRSQSATL